MSALMDEIIETTLKDRAGRMAIQVINDMNMILYGPRRSYTRRERVVMRLQMYQRRVSDAWLVLTGKAYIVDCD